MVWQKSAVTHGPATSHFLVLADCIVLYAFCQKIRLNRTSVSSWIRSLLRTAYCDPCIAILKAQIIEPFRNSALRGKELGLGR